MKISCKDAMFTKAFFVSSAFGAFAALREALFLKQEANQ